MAIINPQDVNNIVSKIDAIPDCDDLVEFANKQFNIWAKQMSDALRARNSAIVKRVAPTNLEEVIAWIQTFIAEAQQAYVNSLAAIAEVAVAYATITAAITNKVAELGCAAIPIPSLPIVPIPPIP